MAWHRLRLHLSDVCRSSLFNTKGFQAKGSILCLAGGRPPLRPFSLPSNGNVSTPVLRTTARQMRRPPHEALKYYPHILIGASLSLLLITLAVILFVVGKKQPLISSYASVVLLKSGLGLESGLRPIICFLVSSQTLPFTDSVSKGVLESSTGYFHFQDIKYKFY